MLFFYVSFRMKKREKRSKNGKNFAKRKIKMFEILRRLINAIFVIGFGFWWANETKGERKGSIATSPQAHW